MRYELIPIFFVLAIPLLSGLALVVDAVRRGVTARMRGKHDLHA
jgi:hypothetical protein